MLYTFWKKTKLIKSRLRSNLFYLPSKCKAVTFIRTLSEVCLSLTDGCGMCKRKDPFFIYLCFILFGHIPIEDLVYNCLFRETGKQHLSLISGMAIGVHYEGPYYTINKFLPLIYLLGYPNTLEGCSQCSSVILN